QEPEKETNKKNGFTLGLALSPLVNNAGFSHESNINLGAGVLAEIPVARRLALYTGLMMSNQELSYANPNSAARTTVSGSHRAQTSLHVLGLDLPINIKYDIHQGDRSQIYLAAGVSSLAYLSENYQYDYTTEQQVWVFSGDPSMMGTDEAELGTNTAPSEDSRNLFTATTVQSTETSHRQEGAFQTFDWARLINLSFGMAYDLGAHYNLMVEPYYKMPIGALTSEQVTFGTGGVILRFNYLWK
ncbi:MAG: PorT family protein, partial [Cytophagales bacterium]|nr:PorT family protein [Cytophagales bacterium]